MSTLRKAGHAIRVGLGIALVGALALVAGSASADADDTVIDGESLEPATDTRATPNAVYNCSMSSGTIQAQLRVHPDGIYCSRTPLPGAPLLIPGTYPSCHQVAKFIAGCVLTN